MHKTNGFVLGAGVLFVIAASFAYSQNRTVPATPNLFPWGALRQGQRVVVGGEGSLSYIRVFEEPALEAQAQYRIKEIRPDGLVVEVKSTGDDSIGDAEIYFPWHAIHSVTVIKAK